MLLEAGLAFKNALLINKKCLDVKLRSALLYVRITCSYSYWNAWKSVSLISTWGLNKAVFVKSTQKYMLSDFIWDVVSWFHLAYVIQLISINENFYDNISLFENLENVFYLCFSRMWIEIVIFLKSKV